MPGLSPKAEDSASAHPPETTHTDHPGHTTGIGHVPHGYVHPKERHHWYWYAGLSVASILLIVVPVVMWQLDSANLLLCKVSEPESLSSPDGSREIETARVSCLGGAEQQKVFLRRENGGRHTVASFDDAARIRVRWRADNEIVITQRGGKIWSFQPVWDHVRIRYVL